MTDQNMLVYARIINRLYFVWEDYSLLDDILPHWDELKDTLDEADAPYDKAETLLNIARYHDTQVEYEESKRYLDEALALIKDDETEEAQYILTHIETMRGLYFYRAFDDAQARSIWEVALERAGRIPEEGQRRERQATLRKNLARLSMIEGNIDEACEHLEDGIKAIKGYNDALEAELHGLYGEVEAAVDNLDKAKSHFEDGLSLTTETENPAQHCNSLSDLGNLMLMMADYSQAETYFVRGLRILDRIVLPKTRSLILRNIGDLKNQMKEPDEALKYLEEALEIDESENKPDPDAICGDKIYMANSYFLKDDSEKAKSLLEEIHELTKKHNLPRREKQREEILANPPDAL